MKPSYEEYDPTFYALIIDNIAFTKFTANHEDYDNIDLLCNLCDVIYNHCYKQNNLTKSESRNFKELCTGMKSIIRSIKQYDVSTKMDNTLISQLTGYLTKINRNYFNDRHR